MKVTFKRQLKVYTFSINSMLMCYITYVCVKRVNAALVQVCKRICCAVLVVFNLYVARRPESYVSVVCIHSKTNEEKCRLGYGEQ